MKQLSTRFLQISNEIKEHIREMTIADLTQWLAENKNFYLIDVREESEWQQGKLPRAIHLSKGVIERDIEKTVADPNATLVLYCGGGHRSALAAYNLQKMGYTQVLSLAGGFRGWQEAGGNVVATTEIDK